MLISVFYIYQSLKPRQPLEEQLDELRFAQNTTPIDVRQLFVFIAYGVLIFNSIYYLAVFEFIQQGATWFIMVYGIIVGLIIINNLLIIYRGHKAETFDDLADSMSYTEYSSRLTYNQWRVGNRIVRDLNAVFHAFIIGALL